MDIAERHPGLAIAMKRLAAGLTLLVGLLTACGGTAPSPSAATSLAPTATITAATAQPTSAPTLVPSPTLAPTSVTSPASSTAPSPTAAVKPAAAPAPTSSAALPPGYTTDSSGRLITPGGNVSREAPPGPSIPPGATGHCRDGTYSFAANHRGMCSSHGGVAQFYS